MSYRLARAIGFRMDPERAHRLALAVARLSRPVWAIGRRRREASPVEVMGLRFRNPLGLAAGYDKDAVAWRALGAMGFGHVEVGTVTPQPQPGNPRPRLHRLVDDRALVNRMGFPGAGAEAVAGRLRGGRPGGLILGVSIGPNAATPPERRLDDYRVLVARFAPLADYLAVNVSSPNTQGLRSLERPEEISGLLGALRAERDVWVGRIGRRVPLVVKLSPDLSDAPGVAASAEEAGADGIVMGNTTIERPGIERPTPEGGLSGEPLAPLALQRLHEVVAASRLPVISCGGIMSPRDVAERLAAGAALVQIYTGLVYAGPGLVGSTLRELRGDY